MKASTQTAHARATFDSTFRLLFSEIFVVAQSSMDGWLATQAAARSHAEAA